MRIGELSTRTGVSVRSLRYYEEQGLLASIRSESGQRHYGESAVERVAFIQLLYTAGLSSKTILDVLPCSYAPSEQTSDAAADRMAVERDRLSTHIDDLLRTRDTLDELIKINRAHRATL
ncbi:MerR family transcriptional regulator [Kribbella antibiotica]|uniref:MerR family transcriptional regulator n=2 Tax=Kribbella antibiotica TaxID=190195 RepID=A0A4R4ZKT2_9ACTN|nr:MerR family transcriptional regulator [Kribbella antibiotica]